MDLHKFDNYFQWTCNDLLLPMANIRAFAAALSGLDPFYQTKHGNNLRVGVMALPVKEAMDYGCTSEELWNPEKNIYAGCLRLRDILCGLDEVHGFQERLNRAMIFYCRGMIWTEHSQKLYVDYLQYGKKKRCLKK